MKISHQKIKQSTTAIGLNNSLWGIASRTNQMRIHARIYAKGKEKAEQSSP